MKVNVSELKSNLFLLALLLFSLPALTGCGSESEQALIDNVPDTATTVTTINLDRLFREAGCPTPTSEGKLKPEAEGIMNLLPIPDKTEEALTSVITAGDFSDLENLITFNDKNGKTITLLKLKDPKRLQASFVAAGFEDSEKKGFKCYSDEMTYAVSGNILWIAPSVDEIATAAMDSKSNRFGTIIGVRQFLDTKNEVNIAANCGANGMSFLGDASHWICTSVKVNERVISLNTEVMDRDGKLDSIGNRFGQISTDFLRYVPNNAVLVAAVGKCDPALIGFVTTRLPFPINAVDGTCAAYALPASDSAEALKSVNAWNLFGMAKMRQRDVDNVINQFKLMTGAREENGQYRMENSIGSAPIYFGDFDGCLVMSQNRPISSDFNNSFTQDFAGRRLAILLDIPADSPLLRTWELPCGVNLKISLETEKLMMNLSFNGSDTDALPTLLKFAPLEKMIESL